MTIGSNEFKYEWIEDWAKIPDRASGKENGRTHGAAVAKNGNIIVFNQADPAVLIFDKSGKLLESWGDRFHGAHGLTLVNENGKEYLWLTDQYSAEVVKTDLKGKSTLNINKPDLDIYKNGKYSPTWAAEFETSKGGNGDVWVADGYGSSLVHRFDQNGKYILTLTGEEGAGKFNCPHSLFIDYRKSEPELYIADRGNKRFQVYNLAGKFKREFGSDFLGCPCGGFVRDDLLFVPELCARLAVLDSSDKLITYLGQNEQTCEIPGWPNHKKELIKEGKFNSPHDLTVDEDGNIYIVEWIIGGRIIKLEKI